jgi:hypothetical protein
MRLYGVIQAFRRGRMPDNAQIDETLKYFITTSPIDINKLSPEGQKLVTDVRSILETVSARSFHPNPASSAAPPPIYFRHSQCAISTDILPFS